MRQSVGEHLHVGEGWSVQPAALHVDHGRAKLDVDVAQVGGISIKAARRAYEKIWSRMPGRERGKYLYRIARIIQEKAHELAVLETMAIPPYWSWSVLRS